MVLPVKMNDFSYDVVIEKGALKHLNDYLDLKGKTLIVADENVPSIFREYVAKACEDPYLYIMQSGEKSKSIESFKELTSLLIKNNFTRSDNMVALGGGVAGDLTGFVASCYMRGIKFYNIPTTLLSEVDSSIGGKTAIDFDNVKNIVGAFYPPHKVIIDPSTLDSLDDREIHAGLAEAIKMAACFNKDLFYYILNTNNLKENIAYIIEESLKIKRYVVENDPKEKGMRKVLNYGHTVGHAIESLSDGKLLHGECVALGMLYFSSDKVKEELVKILDKYDLYKQVNFTKDEILSYIVHDKKAKGKVVSTIFVNEIGSYEIREISVEEIKALL